MLGLLGNTSSSRVYPCVACSATFSGLASLLVHQATHALPNPQPVPSTAMYICDCGDEFLDFSAMMEHKRSHVTEEQELQKSHDNQVTANEELSQGGVALAQGGEAVAQGGEAVAQGGEAVAQGGEAVAQGGEAVAQGGEAVAQGGEAVAQGGEAVAQTEEAVREDAAANAAAVGPSVGPSAHELLLVKNTVENADRKESAVDGNDTRDHSPASTAAGQLTERALAAEEELEEEEGNKMDETEPKSKLMKILVSAYEKHIVHQSLSEDDGKTIKEEPELVMISQEPSRITDTSAKQLKRPGKSGTKTKAPSIGKLLESSTKKIVSLTSFFSPVVLLETRNKFKDPSTNLYGKYLCGRCRRVFQDADSLTEHHFLHKKERIKCCRCCKQLIIGRVPLPDNHVCPLARGKATTPSLSYKSVATNRQNTLHMNNMKKVFFCPLCKHHFPRRSDLNMHKCQSESSPSLQTRSENLSQSIGVGTRSIKIEDTSEQEYENELSSMSWSSASSLKEQHLNVSGFAASFLQEQNSEWTMSVKSEGKNPSKRRARLSFYIKNGVKRYPCNNCHKTFGMSSNLSRHRKLYCTNSLSLGTGPSSNRTLVNTKNIQMFSCYVCGRNFNRKDNMMTHRNKCEMKRTMITNNVNEMSPSLSPPQAPLPLPEEEEEDDAGSWSIMSLPSVLPRRVTCECGVGFTSPKLLLEHLQKHAQESYTCPTCGITANSWANYEIHLQLHMHPQHHRSLTPLMLQLKMDVPNSLHQNAIHSPKALKSLSRKLFTCPKCGNNFATRCSFRRHLTWTQCKDF